MYLSLSDQNKKSTASDKVRSRVSFSSCSSRLLSRNEDVPSKSACACGGTCPRCQKPSDGVKRELVPDLEPKNGVADNAASNLDITDDDDERCPKQTISADETSCNQRYGAYMRLCYRRARGWWAKEEVTQ